MPNDPEPDLNALRTIANTPDSVRTLCKKLSRDGQ